MGRKRAPEHDYICRRCGCPCESYPGRHVGGGQGMRSCRTTSDPVLRRDFEEEARDAVASMRLYRR